MKNKEAYKNHDERWNVFVTEVALEQSPSMLLAEYDRWLEKEINHKRVNKKLRPKRKKS